LLSKFSFFALFYYLAFIFLFPKTIQAYTEAEEVCYGQCAAYKFVWQGDYCYDTFQSQCAMGKGNTIKETIKFLKSIKGVLQSGSGVDNVFKAWFVCKPLIENCIVPQLQECRSTCSIDNLFYAPDLSVGHPYGNFVYHGVVYNDRDKTLTFKVVNNGRGYAWDIGASASWGHTRNRDGLVSGGGQLFSQTIPEMIYFGARNGPPKTVGDYVTDFLIEESNFAKYLQGFKSDADDYNVPVIWLKTIPFTAPEGELTKVIFNVDPNQMITEYSELNNTFVLTIDNLPTPPSFQIDNFTQRLENNTLNNFLVDFNIKNTGEENGEATIKFFEDKYNSNPTQTSIWQSTQVVQGLNKFNFNTFINPNISTDDTYCGKTKRYELVVFKNNVKVDSHEFSLPLYSGSVRGRVEDLFGKGVEGATVTTSSGQTTTTSKTGSYFLKGINQLGKVTITVTHPEFSRAETREIDFKMGDGIKPCDEGNLTFNQVDFVLKDQDVNFTIAIKDSFGNPITAQVLATNTDWRFNETIEDNGPLPGMQPGEYFFTISAPGYKTIGQTVNAIPNQQNLEFVMELLNGRLTDGGLTIFDQPQLLWQMDRGEEIFAKMTATKDGKEVILYTVKNKANTGKLYFLDTLTGNQIKVVSGTIATGGQSQSCLDTSYDGNTTALFVHNGTFGISGDTRNVLKLFNNQGNEIGTTDFQSGGGAHECDVSPDGFYVYPDKLLNKGLYTYTRFDISGIENSTQAKTYSSLLHFTTADNLIAGCATGGGQCLQTLNNTVIANLGNLNGFATAIDSNQDASSIVIATISKAYLFRNGTKAWEKDTITRGDPLSISVTPGGKYVIYSTEQEQVHGRIFKIFTDNNLDKTFFAPKVNEDVIFVHANDKGIFYAAEEGKILKYYQVGSYSTDYNPQTPPPTTSGKLYENNISYYENGVWFGLGQTNYYQLSPWKIYMANTDLNFDMQDPYGTLRIKEGTLFAVDMNHHPILLKGQMTADFGSPAILYALKFDRYDLDLFIQKISQFIAGNLPQSEYFIIQNIHTRFTLKNNTNDFQVLVDNGQVQIIGKDIDQKVDTGRQITIDGQNNVKESIYLGWKIYAIIAGVIVLISSVLLFVYRETKVGKKIIVILKIIGKVILKYGKILILLLWKYLLKALVLIYQSAKIVLPKIYKIIKKLILKLGKKKK